MARKKRVKKWIQRAIKRPGAFTAKAKRHGMTVAQFARYVLAHKSRFDTTTIRQAVLALRLRKMAAQKKSKKTRRRR